MPPTLFERLASRGICPPTKSAASSSNVRQSLLPLTDSTTAATTSTQLKSGSQLEDVAVPPQSLPSTSSISQPTKKTKIILSTKERTPRKRRLRTASSEFVTPRGKRKPLVERQRQSSSAFRGSPHGLRFSSISETCGICCDSVDASEAVRFRCDHGWYCKSCVSRHVEARLDIGTVRQSCPECDTELFERDLKRLIPQQLMERLLTRSLEQAVASTANLRSCPTPNCPMRVELDADDTAQFTCPTCNKECCLRCGAQPYHKRMTCEQYAKRMEKHNRRCSFMKWMKATGSKQCPSCSMAVTKEDLHNQSTQASECHKMLCRNCNTRFCFKCLAILTDSYSCGCTKDEHGFVDPRTGKYVRHLKKKKQQNANSKLLDKENDKPKHDWRKGAAGA